MTAKLVLTLPPTAYQILWLLQGGGRKDPPQLSWKESFWTLYGYRPFDNRAIKRSHAAIWTKISKIEQDIEICKF